jgi:hypothetical protein
MVIKYSFIFFFLVKLYERLIAQAQSLPIPYLYRQHATLDKQALQFIHSSLHHLYLIFLHKKRSATLSPFLSLYTESPFNLSTKPCLNQLTYPFYLSWILLTRQKPTHHPLLQRPKESSSSSRTNKNNKK